jgi:Alw26I/Eco31I/Esp3I family type II restriction endonuclease
MEMIVDDCNYAGMPGARQDNRIMWQVSSGKTTSFYKFYLKRAAWWTVKADSLKLPGTGNSEERFSIAARQIHPTGYRPCRLCGTEHNVGYFYLNARFAKHLSKLNPPVAASATNSIAATLDLLRSNLAESKIHALLDQNFVERAEFFAHYGYTAEAFKKSNYLRSVWLSPGFMCNPPDRLDGFHDYCIECRGKSDPGRSKENLRSYSHDRRAFEWWAEGDWMLADALYNSAGAGNCNICGVAVNRVSPDHPGPLACGFKHMPLFIPTCQRCNSAKNRRMRASDVVHLREYEETTGDSTASRHVRPVWDANKGLVKSDEAAKILSTAMREVQHHYLNLLHELLERGHARFLSTLLRSEYAYYDFCFEGLDAAQLTFTSVSRTSNRTLLRSSLARRNIRIAFDELKAYAEKLAGSRRFGNNYKEYFAIEIPKILRFADSLPRATADQSWNAAAADASSADERETIIGTLLPRLHEDAQPSDIALRGLIDELFTGVAKIHLNLD